MEWIKSNIKLPEFGMPVLVKCKIYGRYVAIYDQIDNTGWGEWKSDGKIILRPDYWMPLPE